MELIEIFDSAKNAVKSVGIAGNSSTMRDCAINKEQYMNFYWSKEPIEDFSNYFDNSFNYYVFDFANKFVNTFKNLEDLGKFLGIATSTVSVKLKNSDTINSFKIIKNTREFQFQFNKNNKKIKI